MKEVKFYRCPVCGNVIEKIVDSGISVVCCGKQMEELHANMEDGAKEKHVPVIEHTDDALVVSVGEVTHPMEENHFICFVTLVTENAVTRVDLRPGEEPTVIFGDVIHGTVYEYCNVHGLWKKEF